jgi:hypothetical protein
LKINSSAVKGQYVAFISQLVLRLDQHAMGRIRRSLVQKLIRTADSEFFELPKGWSVFSRQVHGEAATAAAAVAPLPARCYHVELSALYQDHSVKKVHHMDSYVGCSLLLAALLLCLQIPHSRAVPKAPSTTRSEV